MELLPLDDLLPVIFSYLDDKSLAQVPQVSRRFDSALTEVFWKNQSRLRWSGLVDYRDLFMSWREFYIGATGASYMLVMYNKKALFYNKISEPIEETIRYLRRWRIIPDITIDGLNELPELVGDEKYCDLRLYVVFPGQELDLDDHRQLLLGRLQNDDDDSPFIIKEKLIDLPTLNQSTLFYYKYRNIIGVRRINTESVRKILDIDHVHVHVIKVGDNSVGRLFLRRSDDVVFIRKKTQLVDSRGQSFNQRILLSDQSPSIIIDQIDEEFKIAVIPDGSHLAGLVKNWRLQYRQHYSELTWEPIERLKKELLKEPVQ